MKQDIRDLFREEEDLKTPPENHRSEFLDKLKKQSQSKKVGYTWLKIAAVVIITLAVGFTLLYRQPTENVAPIVAQVEAVEAEYLKEINAEWQNFVAIAEDEVLVERFKKKLDELDADYKNISIQFRANPNNLEIVELLIDNLQTRSQILKDIQEHIKILNQNNEQYEKSI
ncbi:hypothetical protein BWZ20_04745 [Winogradskyella sp. J14-2]|uniref:hypothetical protein n=1 Tax=Winogradskyella sp. J14-2 TaxID=1936080 RepID=UPI00097276FE|nr:hypothetical protein [Winogradskyella sp. J14-2]APY07649.1 hypothetical protein BWZ20_04745 [Winogradskyella sp. J14-2]